MKTWLKVQGRVLLSVACRSLRKFEEEVSAPSILPAYAVLLAGHAKKLLSSSSFDTVIAMNLLDFCLVSFTIGTDIFVKI